MKCGTQAGYQRHRYRGEPKCDACLEANARKSAEYRGGYVHGPRGRQNLGVKDAIIDTLSAHARWLTAANLAALILDRHPDWLGDSIRRTLYRLVDQGRVQRRQGADGFVEFFSDEWAVW